LASDLLDKWLYELWILLNELAHLFSLRGAN
jgi:hypothetical protein